MRPWLQKSALIQPKTSLGKSDVSWLYSWLYGATWSAPRSTCRCVPGHIYEISRRHITPSEARSRLDQRRFSRPNTHFSAFFEIYKKIIFSRANFVNFCLENCKNLHFLKTFFSKLWKILQKFCKNLQNFRNLQNQFCPRVPKDVLGM